VVVQMKRIKRISIVLIALGMIVSLAMVLPASAQTGTGNVKVLDSEFVFCTMDHAGEIEEIQVFDWLSLNGDGTTTVREKAAFDDIGSYQGVKGFTTPSVEDGYIVWPTIDVDGPANVIAATKLSESDVEEARTRIPLDVRFKYWFDGAPVTDPGTLTGKSGRFKMELTLTNTSAEKTEIEYEDPATGEMVTDEVDTYLPLVILPYDWYFDNSIFFNLEADPTGLIVNMPDFYNVGWSIPLFPPATEESHTIWVAADVENFQLPPLTLAVAFVFPETNQADPMELLGPAMVQIYDGMKSVAEGIGSPDTTDTLLYGITAVDDGINQLAAGLPEAKSSLDNLLIPGIDQATAAIGSPTTDQTLLYANSAVLGGLQFISTNIGSTTTDATLLYAANAIVTNLQTISDGLGSASNPTSVIGGIYGVMIGLGYDPATPGVLQGLQQISAGLGSVGTPLTVIDGLSQIAANMDPSSPASVYAAVAGVSALMKSGGGGVYDYVAGLAIPADPQWAALYQPTILGTLAAYTPNLDAAAGGIATMYGYLTAPYPNGIIPVLQYMKGALDTQLIPGIQQMLAGLPLIYGGLVEIQNGIGTVTTPDTLLFAAAAIEGGLEAVKAGIGDTAIDNTLLFACAAIQNGLYQLKAGLSTGNINDPGIKEGLILISAGIGDAITGLGTADTPDTLAYGSNAVASGLTELGDGATQLEDGLAMVVGTLNMTEAELEVIHMRGEEFDHFLGRAEGEKNEVRFVYQSNATYNYETGNSSSWILAIVLSVVIALALIAGGILLARRGEA